MKALVYTQSRHVEIQQLPDPQLKPGHVLVRVRAAGICGSDLDGFLGHSKKRIPPLVLGHEFSGEIADTADDVVSCKVGDPVAVYPLVTCGECAYCHSNRPQICVKRKLFGLDFHGGLAEYVVVPHECAYRMNPTTSFVSGALVEPLANALHVAERCGDLREQVGLVYGAGSIGIFSYWVARHFGARRLAIVDTNPYRLATAGKLGADLVIDAQKGDVVQAVMNWTEEQGVDFAIDAVGHDICRRNTVACTAPGGIIVWIGLGENTTQTDARAVVTRELDVKGSYAYTRENFAQALNLVACGALPTGLLVSEHPLETGQQIFEELTSGYSRLTKVVFHI